MERSRITIPLMVALVIATVFCTDVTLAIAACSVNDDCPLTSWVQYCKKTVGDCDGIGECTTRPDVCIEGYVPVCGCDGKTYANSCIAAAMGVNVNYLGACRLVGDLLVDTEFNGNATSADLLADSLSQDWYESRGDDPDGPGLLTLNEESIWDNGTKKAKLQASDTHSAYLTQEFSSPQSGTFTVRWNVSVDEIWDSDLDRGAMMIIGDNSADGTTSDEGKGPNSTSSERFAFMAFWSPGGGGNTAGDTMRLIAMEPGDSYNNSSEWRRIATGLEFDAWHTIAVVCDVFNDTYDVYVNGILKAVDVQAYTGKDIVTHISFAQFSRVPATFYVDNVVTPLGKETKLLASDSADTDWFGDSVAISGNVALVGAPLGDKNIGDNAGAVYVYNYVGSEWVQQQKLTATDGASSDYFGTSVAISGDVALVGAYGDDDRGSGSGSAYVFRRIGSSWVQEEKVSALDGASSDYFGTSVAISGDVALVGAYGDDDKGSDSGSAYVFRRIGSSWVQEEKVSALDGASSDYFGASVAISGNVALVGARRGDQEIGDNAGAVYVYHYVNSEWAQKPKLRTSDGQEYDRFGSSVSITDSDNDGNGDLAIIGAPGNDDDGNQSSGSAYIFRYKGGEWVEEDKLLASMGDEYTYFGNAVAISGDVVVIGKFGAVEGWFPSRAAHVYCFDGYRWIEQRRLFATDGHIMDYFGYSIAISDDVALVGARFNEEKGDNAGAAYVFTNLCCTDNDNDGFSAEGEACGPVDCNDNDETIYPGAPELCDGLNNDCDGSVDEDLTRVTSCGVGACAGNTGIETCTNGQWGNDTCNPLAGATTEICDGLNNDCDGSVDEDLTRVTSCGVGACAGNTGIETCTNGQWGNDTCNPLAGATTEICDGLNNDCDGSVDEDLTRVTSCGVGACAGNTGIETCTNGQWGNDTCNPLAGATTEICDGLNNDCDGSVDEDLTRVTSCGVGACAGNTGIETCTNGQWGNDTCNPLAGATTEICDGLNNDCDGSVDEDLTRVTSCGVGACAGNTGIETCTNGQWGNDTCNPLAGATTEICDGLNNDCDGSVDEDLTRVTSCGVGACAGNTGIETCTSGQWGNDTCNPLAGATTEICDGKDNNCNGVVDENVCDSDNDGILDSDEDVNGNGAVNPGETDPENGDTDGDGIPDGTELGLTLADIGPATDRNIFRPDMDPKTKTDPFNKNTDGDHLDDGQEDANHNGRIDPCETDPTLPDRLVVVINQIVAPSYPAMVSFVEVTDEPGNQMDDLTESNFSVAEDGVLQSPITVRPPGIYDPISVALCLDYSNSMDLNDKKAKMEEAARSFIQQLGPDDAAEIIIFATEVEVAQAFTTDTNALLAAISDTLDGQTALYDAIYQAVTHTAEQSGRLAVIAMTDGTDNKSDRSLAETIRHAQNSGVPVYTIGLGSTEAAVLEHIADETGGQYYDAPQSSDLLSIYRAIAEVLLNQYMVSYTTKLRGSRSHMLDVRVRSDGLTGSDCQEFVMDRGRAMPWIPLLLLEE